MPTKSTETTLEIKRLERVTIEVPIVGTAPLIVQRWSEKAKQMMLAAQQSNVRTKKEPKDTFALFQASRYLLDDGRDAFPAAGFAAATRGAARNFDGVTLVQLRTALFVVGEGDNQLVPLDIDGEPTMREDTPRNANGVADLRYRAQYWPWRATLHVRFLPSVISPESVIALVDAGGMGGVGEWRPSSPKSLTGSFGTYEVAI